MSQPDLSTVLRDIATALVVECRVCEAPILSGLAMTSIRERQTVCPACALEEAAAVAVRELTPDGSGYDLLTLQRASEVLTTTAGMFAASVGATAKKGTP